jgi:hypothetical protein
VAFGNDGLALIVTRNELLLLDPVSGATQARRRSSADRRSTGFCLIHVP